MWAWRRIVASPNKLEAIELLHTHTVDCMNEKLLLQTDYAGDKERLRVRVNQLTQVYLENGC